MRRTFATRTISFVLPVVVFACIAIVGFGFHSSAEDKKIVAPNISGVWGLHGRIGPGGAVKKIDEAEGRSLKFVSTVVGARPIPTLRQGLLNTIMEERIR